MREKFSPNSTEKSPQNRLNTRINTRVFVALSIRILKRKEENPVVHIHTYVMALFSSEDDESENRTNPLWKVLQKSFVSYKKLQFSKRMYAMKNSIFSRRIHDESKQRRQKHSRYDFRRENDRVRSTHQSRGCVLFQLLRLGISTHREQKNVPLYE